jgi:amylosucrase
MTPEQARASAAERLGASADELLARLEREWPALQAALELPYGAVTPRARRELEENLVRVLADAWEQRAGELRELDREREQTPDWYQRPEMIGYATYVDRFAGDLPGLRDHLDYLEELGIRYLHLMPLLATRSGPNDGGYAVTDYRRVEPSLGTMDDLRAVAAELRRRRVSLCTDLVLNHVAIEHPWAQRALAGEPAAEAMFHIFPDRTWPDRYEATLPEVFPAFKRGSFTQLDDGRWVWTTFNDYQWDLNWANPRVFVEVLELLLFLANAGVEVVRLDAVAFLWKREGTDCQNQAEAHALLQALRICSRIAAPAVAHKAEAIVSPDDLIPYLGSREQVESDLAYHNSLMVQYWAALAPAHTGLMVETLRRFPSHPPAAAWVTYLRSHDDIGWAVTDELANAVGIADAGAHRRWLADYYAGLWPDSFSRGAHFQENEATGDRRTSGSMASLAGLERALELGDDGEIDLAIRRILLGHALIYAYDGVPVIWMGDEIGLLNDLGYRDDSAHADDNRWMHRPRMDWEAAARRHVPGTVEARLFEPLRNLGRVRAGIPQLHAAVPLEVRDVGNPELFALVRPHAVHGPLLAVFNFAPRPSDLRRGVLAEYGLLAGHEQITNEAIALEGDRLVIGPYQALWVTRSATP